MAKLRKSYISLYNVYNDSNSKRTHTTVHQILFSATQVFNMPLCYYILLYIYIDLFPETCYTCPVLLAHVK